MDLQNIHVSFITYFRLLVFGTLVTLVAWFSFHFLHLARGALQNINKGYVTFPYFRNNECRMMARGKPVQPVVGAGFCPGHWDF